MRRKFFVVWHLVAVFALLMLFTPALHAQAPNQSSPQNLSCSPAPCILPNVQVSKGTAVNSNVISVNPNNPSQLLVGGEDFNCRSIQGFYSSNDGGSTWTQSCFPTHDGSGEPIVGYDLNNVAYAGGTADLAAIIIRSSTDNGINWTGARGIAVYTGGITSPWLQVDTNPNSPFKNTIYVSSIYGGFYSISTQVHVTRSFDVGHHDWRDIALDQWQFPGIDVFAHLSVGTDGSVYATWLRCERPDASSDCDQPIPVMFSKSSDGGHTWSKPVAIAQVAVNTECGNIYGCLPNTTRDITNIPVAAAFGSGAAAKVYVAFYNWTGSQMQVEVATSTDGGTTFGPPVRVTNSNSGDEFFQWISLASDGTVGVTWLDRRNDPTNVKYQPFFATSPDGMNFSPARPLSTAQSDPTNPGFYGSSYRTHVWVGDAIYATWMDTRSGTCRIELGGVQF